MAAVTIADSAPGSPQIVALEGNGISAAPNVLLSPPRLSFGARVIGVQQKPQTMTLTNIGGSALVISSITTSGDFTQTNNCVPKVAPQASCTINVTFMPTGEGVRLGSLLLQDDASNSPQSAPLRGVGTGVSLIPDHLDFGFVAVGTKSKPKIVTLTNVGSSSLDITSIVMPPGGPFSETDDCVGTVAVQGSCTIVVVAEPTSGAIFHRTMEIYDDGGGSPQGVRLNMRSGN